MSHPSGTRRGSPPLWRGSPSGWLGPLGRAAPPRDYPTPRLGPTGFRSNLGRRTESRVMRVEVASNRRNSDLELCVC